LDPNPPPPAWLAFAIVGGFLIVFPIFWCFVCGLLSWMGGWSRLAKLYLAPPQAVPQGRSFTWRSGKVGLTNYKGTLTIHTGPSGLHLSVMPLFRFGHPPLLIPWEELKNPQSTTFGFSTAMKCAVGSPAVATLVLPPEVFEEHPKAHPTEADRAG